ncbi:MAG: hypothetical protein E6182_18840 [Clostridioides difficile]|nr:hypothetical protein [Clostridioides difficile]
MNETELTIENLNNFKPCPVCFGVGRVKVMQSVVGLKRSFRGRDTEIKCSYCKGDGVIYK